MTLKLLAAAGLPVVLSRFVGNRIRRRVAALSRPLAEGCGKRYPRTSGHSFVLPLPDTCRFAGIYSSTIRRWLVELARLGEHVGRQRPTDQTPASRGPLVEQVCSLRSVVRESNP